MFDSEFAICHQTFINSSSLFMCLMALQVTHVDPKTFQL